VMRAQRRNSRRVREPRSWTRAAVVAEIKRHAAHGHELFVCGMVRRDRHLVAAARRHFGCWRHAIRACGYDYSTIRQHRVWTAERVARDLRDSVKRHGELLPWRIKAEDSRLYYAVAPWFGSFRDAAHKLDLQYDPPRQWSKRLVVDAVRCRKRAKQSLCWSAVREHDLGLLTAARKHHGSWESAVRAAGFDYGKMRRRRRYSVESIGRELRTWVRAHGSLNPSALKKTDGPLLSATERRHGSLEKAAEAYGLPYFTTVQRWSAGRVVERIQHRARLGLSLGLTAVRRSDHSLFCAAYRYYRSWKRAAAAAGFNGSARRG